MVWYGTVLYGMAWIFCIATHILSCACKDGSAVASMVSSDTASMKELDLLSKDIEDLKRYTHTCRQSC